MLQTLESVRYVDIAPDTTPPGDEAPQSNVDRHVTVILNGTTIINNQPLLGCTGGALWSDEFRPGPVYLQGDHTSVDYRNIVIHPVVKPD